MQIALVVLLTIKAVVADPIHVVLMKEIVMMIMTARQALLVGKITAHLIMVGLKGQIVVNQRDSKVNMPNLNKIFLPC